MESAFCRFEVVGNELHQIINESNKVTSKCGGDDLEQVCKYLNEQEIALWNARKIKTREHEKVEKVSLLMNEIKGILNGP